ncbi:MAG: hypothetical protein DMG91_12790 [Acidobacteria bacterium]|nr:MAG: hypothetical protein DMG91_12790 [Acidobacteriota bacterium]
MVFLAGWLAVSAATQAQTCFTGSDMDASTRTALVNTGQKYFNFASLGDVASLRQNAIPSLAANFAGIESAVIENKPALSGGSATPRSPFLLKAEGAKPLERAEFLCGVFGAQGQTANSAEFVIPNLPPGNYGIVTLDVAAQKPSTVTFVLQQQGTDWKLGGFFAKPSQVSGHDGNWFLQQARSYKAKGQNRIAWFYYLEARELLVPVSFMYTQSTDKAYDEMQTVKPSDLPPFDLSGAGKTYKVMDMFPVVVGSDLDLVVKYQSASVSDTGQTFQENMAVMKALAACIFHRAARSTGRVRDPLLGELYVLIAPIC